MGDSLNVILTEGSNKPVILVHKGWKIPQRSSGEHGERSQTRRLEDTPNVPSQVYFSKGPSHDRLVPSGPFEFVNATPSLQKQGPETRKLIKAHARRHTLKQKQQQNDEETEYQELPEDLADSGAESKNLSLLIQSAMKTLYNTDLFHSSEKILALCAISKGPELYYHSHPVVLNPHMDSLIIHYLTTIAEAMYPLESLLSLNPLKSEWWLQFAVSDVALFHAVLYGSMVAVGLIEGVKESRLSVGRMNQVILVINKRLTQPSISDATICAVSCLALAEAVRGNLESWRIHMNGLKMMIDTRGGLLQLSTILQMKILRSDLIGAVDFVVAPNFKFTRSGQPSTYSTLRLQERGTLRTGFVEQLRASAVQPQLVSILQELSQFSQAIQYAMMQQVPGVLDPTAFVEDLFSIQHGLLICPNFGWYNQDSHIEEACRITGLLYLKEVLRDFHFSIVGPSKLRQKLKDALLRVPISKVSLPLMIWMLFLGGISSKGTPDRAWFIARLVHITISPNFQTWDEIEEVLDKTLWIAAVQNLEGQQLFNEVETIRVMLIEGKNTLT